MKLSKGLCFGLIFFGDFIVVAGIVMMLICAYLKKANLLFTALGICIAGMLIIGLGVLLLIKYSKAHPNE